MHFIISTGGEVLVGLVLTEDYFVLQVLLFTWSLDHSQG